MKTVFSNKHTLHAPTYGFSEGQTVEYVEKPSRAEFVLGEVKSRKLGKILDPENFSLDPILKMHTPEYVDFLQTAHRDWLAQGYKGNVIASVFNIQHPNAPVPKHMDAKAGCYMADSVVAITPTSWDAIEASAHTALTAQKLISGGEKSAFALCRPPGHHASCAIAAGFCFLNNAAIAAQAFLDDGAKRVSILDIDYHHGNGTQDMFYGRADVQFVSIHADPDEDYPYFLGHAHEKGRGAGEGFNHNYPLHLGTAWAEYAPILDTALKDVANYRPDVLVISLGVDTFKDDPISRFKLVSEDYLKMGKAIASLNLPTLFVMEGGYAIEAVGTNTVNVLDGFLSR